MVFLSKQKLCRALADGEKVAMSNWGAMTYMYLSAAGDLRWNGGAIYDGGGIFGMAKWRIWEEPALTIMVEDVGRKCRYRNDSKGMILGYDSVSAWPARTYVGKHAPSGRVSSGISEYDIVGLL